MHGRLICSGLGGKGHAGIHLLFKLLLDRTMVKFVQLGCAWLVSLHDRRSHTTGYLRARSASTIVNNTHNMTTSSSPLLASFGRGCRIQSLSRPTCVVSSSSWFTARLDTISAMKADHSARPKVQRRVSSVGSGMGGECCGKQTVLREGLSIYR